MLGSILTGYSGAEPSFELFLARKITPAGIFLYLGGARWWIRTTDPRRVKAVLYR
jgi:hypothetical protein